MIEQAGYIWTTSSDNGKDIYRVFRKKFRACETGKSVWLEISADSTFEIHINAQRVKIAQVADFPGHPTFSKVEISRFVNDEEDNVIAVEVHYKGEGFLNYMAWKPFVRAIIWSGDEILAMTDSTWKWAAQPAYHSGLDVKVTGQLGYAFEYNARQEVPWDSRTLDDCHWNTAWCYPFDEAVVMEQRQVPQLIETIVPEVAVVQAGYLLRKKTQGTFAEICFADFCRPLHTAKVFSFDESQKQLMIGLRANPRMYPDEGAMPVKFSQPDNVENSDGCYAVIDLLTEIEGYLTFNINAPAGTVVDICWGEHLDDGRVRSSVGGRNFACRYICKEGKNVFTYTHLRFGGRYLELHFTNASIGQIEMNYVGLLGLEIPLSAPASFVSDDGYIQHLNDLSYNTLKVCMHEHYEDCPWREQGLYPYDSRNQILYGYYAWGNYPFVAANLNLIGQSYDIARFKRYTSLAAPCALDLVIPVFSFVWIVELYEYQLYSGDSSLFTRWQSAINDMIDKALAVPDDQAPGLFYPGDEKYVWNFCEWNGRLSNLCCHGQAPYNIYLHEAMKAAAALHQWAGNAERADFLRIQAERLGKNIESLFWNPDKKCYAVALEQTEDTRDYEHIQVIMLAGNLVPEDKIPYILEHFKKQDLMAADLSALRYVVNALMKYQAGRCQIWTYLRNIFDPAVFSSSTSLWETRQSGDDFDEAGSLCHGWSSVMPAFCGKYILGISPLEPGFKTFLVKPFPVHLGRAKGYVPTPKGNIMVEWTLIGETIHLKLKAPDGLVPVIESYKEYPVVID